jgi:hypothetical protein
MKKSFGGEYIQEYHKSLFHISQRPSFWRHFAADCVENPCLALARRRLFALSPTKSAQKSDHFEILNKL